MVTHSKDTIEYNEIKKIYKRVRGTPITAERMSKIKSATGAIRVFAGGATEIRANVSDLPNANIISDPVVIVQSRGVIDFIYCNVPCTFKNEMWGYTSSDIYAVKFLFYYLKHNVDYFRNAGDGRSSFSQISLPVTEEYKIPLLSSKEQQAIASVLSDFDEHIDNLSELIEKKKAIRDGALEDLVSGRTRLDGFNREWEEKSFKDLGDILTGLTYSPDNIRPSGKLVIRSSNVQDDRLSFEDNVFVDRTCVISEDIKKGDIIICVRNGSVSLIGKSAYASSDLDATFGAFMSNFRCKNHDSSGFVYYFTKSAMFKNFVKQILGATINQITKTDLKRVTLNISVDIEEQQAIASVLTAMDEEIESLKIGKEKMIQIKEGAMDDLLTGRVRLKV